MDPQFPATAQTVFFDGKSGTAALVTKRGKRRTSTERKFPDPHAALDWCIERSAGFVFIPASGN
jgi:hypothetical protein